MKVEQVPLDWVNRVWPQVEPYISEALKWCHGEYTIEHVQALVTTGQWLLLVAVEDDEIVGAATMTLFNRPADRVALITAISGEKIFSEESFAQLKSIAVTRGATCLEGAVRESVARLSHRYGFVEKYRIVGVKL